MNRERNASIEEVLNPSVKTTEFVDLDSSGEGEEEQSSEEDAVTSGAYINFGQVVGTHDFNDLVHKSDSNKIMKAMKSIIHLFIVPFIYIIYGHNLF
jgi:hypothetical protein